MWKWIGYLYGWKGKSDDGGVKFERRVDWECWGHEEEEEEGGIWKLKVVVVWKWFKITESGLG